MKTFTITIRDPEQERMDEIHRRFEYERSKSREHRWHEHLVKHSISWGSTAADWAKLPPFEDDL